MKRALLAIALAVACTLALPAFAFAAEGDYTIDELSTEVTVETNASTHVIERQVVTFDRRNTGYIWYLHVPEDGESVRISSIRVAPVDDGGTLTGDWTRLQLVDSRPSLQGRSPGDSAALSVRSFRTQPWYSYNIGDGMVRCWFPVDSAEAAVLGPSPVLDEPSGSSQMRYMIEADYTIAHRVRVYRDIAELYWRYANSSLPVDAFDVNLQIMLPVPNEALPVEAGADVTAWGHGPDGGTFEVSEDGTVTYHIDKVDRGNYAEAHVIFPAWWLGNVTPDFANVFSEQRASAAIAEESEWVDASKRGETWDFEVRVLFLALAVVVILIGVTAVARFGRSARSRRALVRVAATLGITALGEQLFFREPLTTLLLAAIAAIVAMASLMLPMSETGRDRGEEPEETEENGE